MTLDIINNAISDSKEKKDILLRGEREILEEIENLKASSPCERSQYRITTGCFPYILAGLAAIGLSQAGYVDPSLTGAIALGTGAVAGTIGEAHLVRKIVDSKALDVSSYQNLKDRVYKTIQRESLVQQEITISSMMNALSSAKSGQFEFKGDALNEKKCVEDVLDSLALKIALVENDCSKYVRFNTIAKEAISALGIYGAYMVPLSFSDANINGTQVMIPTIVALLNLLKNGYYESEKRKINKKYHDLMRYDISTDSLIELSGLTRDYANRLGQIEAKLLLTGKSDVEAPVVDDEDDSLFLKIWNDISEEKEKRLYRPKSN